MTLKSGSPLRDFGGSIRAITGCNKLASGTDRCAGSKSSAFPFGICAPANLIPSPDYTDKLQSPAMRTFESLSEREMLALAISLEEEDERIYADFAEGLRQDFPATSSM